MSHKTSKIISCLLLLPVFFVSFNLHAGTADILAGNLQKTYSQASDWKADFIQTTFVELLGKTVEKEGTISIKKPGKIRIEYQSGDGKLYVSDGKKLWVYNQGDSQVAVYKNFTKILASEALSFLRGLGDIRKQFRISNVNTSKKNDTTMMQDKDLSLLGLEPLNSDSLLEKIILGIDAQTQLVREATLFNASGNRTHYLFQNIELNSKINDSKFEFKTPKGVKEVKG